MPFSPDGFVGNRVYSDTFIISHIQHEMQHQIERNLGLPFIEFLNDVHIVFMLIWYIKKKTFDVMSEDTKQTVILIRKSK